MTASARGVDAFPDGLPGIDCAQGLYRLNGNARLYRQLLKGFAAGHGGDAAAIATACEEGDPAAARHLVHGLKGVAGNLGACGLAAAAGALEDALHSPSRPGYPALCREIGRCLDEVVDGIRNLASDHSPAAPATASAGAADSASLAGVFDDLAEQLRTNNTEAILIWEGRLFPALKDRVATRHLETVDDAIQSLDFERALLELECVGAALGLPAS